LFLVVSFEFLVGEEKASGANSYESVLTSLPQPSAAEAALISTYLLITARLRPCPDEDSGKQRSPPCFL
jgi:hypothetical protein